MIGTARQREIELARIYPAWENDTQWTWFCKNSRRFSERIFLIDENQSSTYKDILELVKNVSAGLYGCGVRPGMMAAVDMDNRKELIASVFALSRLGCTAVMVNSKLSHEEREYILKKSDAEVLITDRPYMGSMEPEKELMQILVTGEEDDGGGKAIHWRQMLALSAETPDRILTVLEDTYHDPERTSMLMFTSGSASHPKGVMITDNMLLRSAFATANTRHMEVGRRIYLPIPLFHAMAYVEGMLAAAMVGGSIIISERKTTPEEHLIRMQRYEVNDIVCISSIMIRMMLAALGQSMDFPAMHAAYWAGVCPEWVWKRAREFFHITDCGNGYGMTECGSTSHVLRGTDCKGEISHCHGKLKYAGIAAVPEGTGTILSVRIWAEDGTRECGPGEKGEILLRGISVTKGYYKEPEATAKLFDQDGWMHSGDLGMLDEDGYLTFLGRKDEQFKVNGENVSPEFVGDVLMQHKNVRYAEIVGIPHESCGEAGVAFVEFYDNREEAIPEIQEYIRQKLARFQQPAWIFSINASEWPKTSTGKIVKRALKKMAGVRLKNN